MLDPITLLFGAAYASVFIALLALDIGIKIGRAVERKASVTIVGGGGTGGK